MIAQTALDDRSASRLMLVDIARGLVGETTFAQIGDWLRHGDLLVINDTRVIPVRLRGHKISGGAVELLLLEQQSSRVWRSLVRPGRRMPSGVEVVFAAGAFQGKILERLPSGERLVEFSWSEEEPFLDLLERWGEIPLPPYIHHPLAEKERYQTVYAVTPGSVAAPTAGLHFTGSLLEEIANQGVEIARVTLQIGLGTFRPVKTEVVTDHEMHSERYRIDEVAAQQLNRARESGRRIIAVGTTSCRVLESVISDKGHFQSCEGETSLFITPGYRFQAIDGLITNFHLPRSTLLMLVAAMAGREEILAIYAEAVRQQYRFFSFGDAMFIGHHQIMQQG
ncbi:MAG: tRNA preQ1(34) S-adenosylmethionine ribosyltransferase-isomerase QueA [Symbiobacteriaceae bacterium]|nr:tRNA preQ1(34) S-adenosylmethionine ribosyltransferase-isomerase QueA [Symbiobacteriaceae bacterium]